MGTLNWFNGKCLPIFQHGTRNCTVEVTSLLRKYCRFRLSSTIQRIYQGVASEAPRRCHVPAGGSGAGSEARGGQQRQRRELGRGAIAIPRLPLLGREQRRPLDGEAAVGAPVPAPLDRAHQQRYQTLHLTDRSLSLQSALLLFSFLAELGSTDNERVPEEGKQRLQLLESHTTWKKAGGISSSNASAELNCLSTVLSPARA
ncbi:unnamed protein product [Musa acuminata var. zebrina]